MRVRRLGALLLLALALGGCESSQEESAQLERAAKRVAVHVQRGLSIARASTRVKVLATEALHSSEGAAAVVTLRDLSSHALRDVPIAISVKDAGGGVLYQNNAPGLEAALTSIALLAPGTQFTWIDDQVQASGGAAGGTPTTVTALVGEAQQAPSPTPQIRIADVHPNEEAGSSGAAGTVVNDSPVTQRALVVYGTARRGSQIVAAGRAVLQEVPAHGSSQFQILFIGSSKGAQLQVSAPPTTFG
jgi:hypothetical protein